MVGGCALAYHGAPRFTGDIDVLVRPAGNTVDMTNPTSTEIINIAKAVISGRADEPVFSLLFGSAAGEKMRPFSDVDIAIWPDPGMDVLGLGRLAGDIEEALSLTVDIVDASDLWKRNPVLSFTIARDGRPITVRDGPALVRFKKHSYLFYLDTEHMRVQAEEALANRLKSGHAGKRNYVG